MGHPVLFHAALGHPAFFCAALPCAVLPCPAPFCPALHHWWDDGHIHVEHMQTFSHKCMAGPFVATSMYSSTFFTISSALVTWLPIKDVLLFQN